MQFILNSLVALTAAFATLALAAPEPQTPAQTTQVEQALVSYLSALETDPALLSLASVYETDTAGLQSLEAFGSSLSSVVANHQTPASNFLSAAPTNAQSFYGSVYTAELSIMSQYGFGAKNTASATSTGNAAQPTAKAVGVAAAGVAGFMGVVMAL